MNKKMIILTISSIFVIIMGVIIYNISNTRKEKISDNKDRFGEIAEESENLEYAVTDECLDEWDDYNKYISEKVEEASNNLTEKDTHYLIKDVYGCIEVYYLIDNQEYLYKKTTISTDYLSEEDREDLKVGIEVVGAESLNKMLEDFE